MEEPLTRVRLFQQLLALLVLLERGSGVDCFSRKGDLPEEEEEEPEEEPDAHLMQISSVVQFGQAGCTRTIALSLLSRPLEVLGGM